MAKAKSMKGSLYRFESGNHFNLDLGDGNFSRGFCARQLRFVAPNLVKGIRKGRQAKVNLTQTAKGIKLERV
jgi:hypothetical protein